MAEPKAKMDILGDLDRGIRNTSRIKQICIHTTENSTGTPAENIVNYQIRSRSGSYNIIVDNTRGGFSVRNNSDNYGAWSTGSDKDNDMLNLSFATYSANTREQWLAANGMLEEGARLCAGWAKEYGIPVKLISDDELRANVKGFTSHRQITRALRTSDHTDPGNNFPWDVFFEKVNKHLSGNKPAPAPAQKPAPAQNGEDKMLKDLYNIFTTNYKSLVDGSTFQTNLSTFIRLIDASAYRTEKKVDLMNEKLDHILNSLKKEGK